MRKRVGAKGGYYGNCVTIGLVAAAASGMVAEAGIVDLIKMIKRAKDQLRDKDKMGNRSVHDDMLTRGLGRRYDLVQLASWRNIGFEQVDFGSGAPAREEHHEGLLWCLATYLCVVTY